MQLNKKFFFTQLITASSIGTILEWYDFSLFAFFTPLLSQLYFPHENKLTGLMLTYVIFAIGFLVRPLGAALFGHLGDRVGRKQTLIYSILFMSLATCLMGLLPTYQQIGILAPVLLVILRLCQGLSVGGEATGAVLFVVESWSTRYRGAITAVLWAMTGVGMLLGSAMGSCVMHYVAHFPEIWRVPFLLGIFTGIVGYFVRRNIPESTLFAAAKHANALVKFPLRLAMINYRYELFIIMSLYALSAMITYLIFVFMPTYAANIVGLPMAKTSLISTLGLLGSTVLLPFGGYISDCIGRRYSLFIGAIGFFLLSYPLFSLIAKSSLHFFIFAEIVFVLLAVLFQSAITAAVLELLPTTVRYSVTALGYSVSYSIFGGTAPLLASFLVKITGNHAAPGFYLMLGAVVALFAVSKLRIGVHAEKRESLLV